MKYTYVILLSVFLITVGISNSYAQNPDSFASQAIATEEGTLKTSRYSISLWGLTIPELSQSLHGVKVKLFLDDTMAKKPVRCSVARWRGNAASAQCINHDEKDMGLALIGAGLAFADRDRLAGQPQESAYIQAESDARSASRGLWSLVNPDPSIFNFDQLPQKQQQNFYLILAIVVGGPMLASLFIGLFVLNGLGKMQRDVRKYIDRNRVAEAEFAKREKNVIAAALEGEMSANRSKIDAFIIIYKEMLKNLKDPSKTPKYKSGGGEMIHLTPTLARIVYDQYHDKVSVFEPALVKNLAEIYARVQSESEYYNLEPETPLPEAISKVERVIKTAQELLPLIDKSLSGLQMAVKTKS